MIKRRGTGVNNADLASSLVVGKNETPDGFANKTGFKQCGRRYKFVAGAKVDRVTTFVEVAEARERMAPTVAPDASGIPGAVWFGQHL